MSRQNYYRHRQRRQRRELQEEAVLAWTKEERQVQPKLGARKLLHRMKEQCCSFTPGRDRYLALLKKKDMLVSYEKSASKTTNSYHRLPVFTNRLKTTEVSGPNQAWVCDLTYIKTRTDFAYLFLLSDRYSRKIVGHHVSSKMESADALKALEKAVRDLPADQQPIHHSDRGCQYCSHEYVGALRQRGLEVSMTEDNHCYENAHAERVNGILKREYALGQVLPSLETARKAVDQAVELYNTRRPHWALKLGYPGKIHEEGLKNFHPPAGG
jgi:transposase InsO family protein